VHVCNVFQVFHLSFLYVVSVASECFKSRSVVAHGIRVGREGGMSSPARAMFGGAPPARMAARHRHGQAMPGRRASMRGRRKRTGATAVRPTSER
jgi:hypothetical protein